MEISFTQLRIYLECPWKYKLFFVDRRRIPPSPQSSLGVSLHRTLEQYHRRKLESWEELRDAYEGEFLGSGYATPAEKDQWRKKGERILKRWHEDESSRRAESLGSEREFFYPLGRHTVRGMIDRIERTPEGQVEVIDYKTSFGLGPNDPPPAPPAENLQLRFYALGAARCFALEPKLLTIHYLAAGRRDTSPYDPAQEEELERLIEETADKIERQVWTPDTRFCPRCDFRNDCAYSVAKGT